MPATDERKPPLLDEERLRRFVLRWRSQCGQELLRRRQQRKWSQKQLADLVGVRETSISRFEMGLQTPRDSVRVAIAVALNCEVNDIWPPITSHDASLVARRIEVAA